MLSCLKWLETTGKRNILHLSNILRCTLVFNPRILFGISLRNCLLMQIVTPQRIIIIGVSYLQFHSVSALHDCVL